MTSLRYIPLDTFYKKAQRRIKKKNMGCISCKTILPESLKKENLRGKARLPGIPKRLRKNKVAPIKSDPEDMREKINRERAKILQQLEQENIIAKKATGGVSFVIADDNNEKPSTPVCPPKLLERLERPSSSMGFNYEEKKIMAECLKTESLQKKGRLARLSEERRLAAEANRENAKREKAFKLEMKSKTREDKLRHVREVRQQLITEANILANDRQRQAKCRREYAKKEKEALSGEESFKEKKNYLLNKYTYYREEKDNGLPTVDM